ncbi:hypothetical protein [Lysobacter sp. Root494]|uniref:hypothetical protein n=1 Tax=Lysobacter sp. Root494 TaxID=1736549 RepID=UPI001F43F094|nr:hypothetical protein [Lysobacter sp. Root494]
MPNLDRARAIVRLLHKDDAVAALLRSCNEVGEAFLFGGMVRDAILGASGAFGDIDIFVSGPLDADFARSLSRYSRRTNFGGMRLVVGKFDVDIWELPQSQAFRIEKGRPISIPSLLDTVCFSTDAVAISLLDSRVIATSKFRGTVRDKVLKFVSVPRGTELLQAVRIARLLVKLDLIPHFDIAKYFLAAIAEFGAAGLVKAEEKWKGRRVLDDFLVEGVRLLCESSVTTGVPATLSLDEELFSGEPSDVRVA